MPEKTKNFIKNNWQTIIVLAIGQFFVVFFGNFGAQKLYDYRLANAEKKIIDIEKSIGPNSWIVKQQELQGDYISKLVSNQLSLAKDCKKKLLFHFKELRGDE